MSDLSEAELHARAMRLVCEALADREQQGIEVDWDVLRQMYDQMDAMLQALQHKHRYDSSDMVDLRKDRDAARAEIETLRTQLANAQQELSEQSMVANVETQQDAAAWQQQVDSANAEVSYLRARLDEERSVSAGLREQLADVQRAVGVAFAEVNSVREQLDAARSEIVEMRPQRDETLNMAAMQDLQAAKEAAANRSVAKSILIWQRDGQIAELRAQLDAANAAVALQRAGIERLQAFVELSRQLVTQSITHSGVNRLLAALAELDAEPTPVAEPVDMEGDTCQGQ